MNVFSDIINSMKELEEKTKNDEKSSYASVQKYRSLVQDLCKEISGGVFTSEMRDTIDTYGWALASHNANCGYLNGIKDAINIVKYYASKGK